MRILKARSALLSDFEVLKVLKEMEAEQRDGLNHTSHISEINNDKDAHGQPIAKGDEDDLWLSKVPENLRTIQFETISSLSQTTRPCAHQEADNITAFLDELKARGYSVTDSKAKRDSLGLNRSERLQIVNHAPQSVVELHTLVEELEERFHPHQIEELIALVQTYLPIHPSAQVNAYAAEGPQDDPEAIEDAARNGDAEQPAHMTEFTGQVAAAADLGGSDAHGLAHVLGPDPEREAADLDYEQDPEVEMDQDDFVHEALGGGGVEQADADN
ncbi:related to RPC17 - RNA polymerase III subunit C17 [Ustilago sp. UG-2017a]|nr:related to RPC17 - RNA polymerase III subunit C17 [Ustilago sp. UG-2017a]